MPLGTETIIAMIVTFLVLLFGYFLSTKREIVELKIRLKHLEWLLRSEIERIEKFFYKKIPKKILVEKKDIITKKEEPKQVIIEKPGFWTKFGTIALWVTVIITAIRLILDLFGIL